MATGAGENSYTKNSRIQVTSLSLSLSEPGRAKYQSSPGAA